MENSRACYRVIGSPVAHEWVGSMPHALSWPPRNRIFRVPLLRPGSDPIDYTPSFRERGQENPSYEHQYRPNPRCGSRDH